MKNILMVIYWAASIFMVFHGEILFAQAPATQWLKTFGGINEDTGNSVQETSDGGYIIIGNTHSFGAGKKDIWLIKTDSHGDTLWTKTFGGGDYDTGHSVQQTSDGGYVIAGATNSFGSGGSDVWLIKTESDGDTLWTQTFGGTDDQWGSSVQQTSDGGFIITGCSRNDVLLIKTDAKGDSIWEKTYGGKDYDCGHSVQQTSDGGFIMTGIYGNLGEISGDIWLIKTDSNGDTLWTRIFGFDDVAYDCGNYAQQTTDGGYIITGFTESFGYDGMMDVLLIKTDAVGDTLWLKTFGRNNYEGGSCVQQTLDGGYIITGLSRLYGDDNRGGDAWLIRTNSSGDTLWTKTFGGNDWDIGNSVRQTTDGGYIVTGYTNSFGAGSCDVWLIKIAPDHTTAIEASPPFVISDYKLSQNYPNPFSASGIFNNPTTTIEFVLPKSAFVTLQVYNLLGEKVATLVAEPRAAGIYQFNWDASGLANGVYLYRLEAGVSVQSKKLILIR